MLKIFVLSITITLLFGNIHQANAECCAADIVADLGNVRVCPDGTYIDYAYCGVGPCNIFGCDCAGGCRRNSKGYDKEEARRLYNERYRGGK